MRKLGPAVLFVLFLCANSFATTAVAKASVIPEPGALVLLGGCLVGLATIVRRRFSN
ncbi:MAG: PEP-CTERM sorting domain-containing protein [Terriglobales bacterium]